MQRINSQATAPQRPSVSKPWLSQVLDSNESDPLQEAFNDPTEYDVSKSAENTMLFTDLVAGVLSLGTFVTLSVAMGIADDIHESDVPITYSYIGKPDLSMLVQVSNGVDAPVLRTTGPLEGDVSVLSSKIGDLNPTSIASVVSGVMTLYYLLNAILGSNAGCRAWRRNNRAMKLDWALESLTTPAIGTLLLMLLGVTDVLVLTGQFAATHASVAFLGATEVTAAPGSPLGGRKSSVSWFIAMFVTLVTNVAIWTYLGVSTSYDQLSKTTMAAVALMSIAWVLQALIQKSYLAWLTEPSKSSRMYTIKASPMANFGMYSKAILMVSLASKLLVLALAGFAFTSENNLLKSLQSYTPSTQEGLTGLYASCLNTVTDSAFGLGGVWQGANFTTCEIPGQDLPSICTTANPSVYSSLVSFVPTALNACKGMVIDAAHIG